MKVTILDVRTQDQSYRSIISQPILAILGRMPKKYHINGISARQHVDADTQHHVLPLPRRNVVLPAAPRIEIEPERIQTVRADLLGKALKHHPSPHPGQQRIVSAGQPAPMGMGPAHGATAVGTKHMDAGKPFAGTRKNFSDPDLPCSRQV